MAGTNNLKPAQYTLREGGVLEFASILLVCPCSLDSIARGPLSWRKGTCGACCRRSGSRSSGGPCLAGTPSPRTRCPPTSPARFRSCRRCERCQWPLAHPSQEPGQSGSPWLCSGPDRSQGRARGSGSLGLCCPNGPGPLRSSQSKLTCRLCVRRHSRGSPRA